MRVFRKANAKAPEETQKPEVEEKQGLLVVNPESISVAVVNGVFIFDILASQATSDSMVPS